MASDPPEPKVGCPAAFVGKSLEVVLPATQMLPPVTAMAPSGPEPFRVFSSSDPPKKVENRIEEPAALISVTKAS